MQTVMYPNSLKGLRPSFPIPILLLILLLQSCGPIRLISEYDEITDKTTTHLQEKVITYFVKLERNIGTDNAKYEKFTDFYDDFRVDISILEVRAGAMEKNKIVQEQIVELNKMVNNLETLHKIGFASKEQLIPLRSPFTIAFSSIIKLQMALKRGQK